MKFLAIITIYEIIIGKKHLDWYTYSYYNLPLLSHSIQRLDFESFNLKGTANSQEWDGTTTFAATGVPDGGACSTDTFVVTGSVTSFVPTICGVNSGQHSKRNVD